LLQLRGYDVLSEGKLLSDPEFLEEVLQAREEVREAEDTETIEELTKQNEQKYIHSIQKLKVNFEENDFEEAKRNTIYLQYLTKILEELEQKLNRAIISKLNSTI